MFTKRLAQTLHARPALKRLLGKMQTPRVSRRVMVGCSVFGSTLAVGSVVAVAGRNERHKDTSTTSETNRLCCSVFEVPKIPSIDSIYKRYTKPVVVICAINVAVFAMWKIPRAQRFMSKHFMCSVSGVRKGRVHTLITSVFSHSGPFHLLFNCVAFTSISPVLVQILGATEFIGFYLTAGLLSSIAGLLFQALKAGMISSARTALAKKASQAILAQPGLGASGAVLGCFGVSAKLFPDVSFVFIFAPWFPISASTLLPCIIGMDSLGTLYSLFRNSPLAHAAHLGGVGVGCLYYDKVIKGTNLEVQLRRIQRRQKDRRR